MRTIGMNASGSRSTANSETAGRTVEAVIMLPERLYTEKVTTVTRSGCVVMKTPKKAERKRWRRTSASSLARISLILSWIVASHAYLTRGIRESGGRQSVVGRVKRGAHSTRADRWARVSRTHILITRMPWTISLVSLTRWSVSLSRFICAAKYFAMISPCSGTQHSMTPSPARNDGPMMKARAVKAMTIWTGATNMLLNIGANWRKNWASLAIRFCTLPRLASSPPMPESQRHLP